MKVGLGFVLLAGLVMWLSAHLAIAVGLARSGTWLRAMLALLVPPLAPWWAWSHGMRRRAIAWGAGLAVYVIALTLA